MKIGSWGDGSFSRRVFIIRKWDPGYYYSSISLIILEILTKKGKCWESQLFWDGHPALIILECIARDWDCNIYSRIKVELRKISVHYLPQNRLGQGNQAWIVKRVFCNLGPQLSGHYYQAHSSAILGLGALTSPRCIRNNLRDSTHFY